MCTSSLRALIVAYGWMQTLDHGRPATLLEKQYRPYIMADYNPSRQAVYTLDHGRLTTLLDKQYRP